MIKFSDEELVKKIKEGDVLAFEEIVRRYQKPLFVFTKRIIDDNHSCEEIVQDSLFKAYQSIDRVDTSKKFSTYVFAIAKNTAISYLRSHKKHISLDKINFEVDDHTYEKILKEERVVLVRKAVNKLEEKYRKIVRLYYFEDLSYKEIQEKLGIPLNTVRTHLLRAKDKMQKILSEEI